MPMAQQLLQVALMLDRPTDRLLAELTAYLMAVMISQSMTLMAMEFVAHTEMDHTQ
jgi:hypothetical protein